MVFPSFNHVVVRGVLEQAPRWLGTLDDEMPQMTFFVTVRDDEPDPAAPDLPPPALRVPVVAPWQLTAQVEALQVGEFVLVTGALRHLPFPAADGSVPPMLVVLAQTVDGPGKGASGSGPRSRRSVSFSKRRALRHCCEHVGTGTRAKRDQPLEHAPGLAPGALRVRDRTRQPSSLTTRERSMPDGYFEC